MIFTDEGRAGVSVESLGNEKQSTRSNESRRNRTFVCAREQEGKNCFFRLWSSLRLVPWIALLLPWASVDRVLLLFRDVTEPPLLPRLDDPFKTRFFERTGRIFEALWNNLVRKKNHRFRRWRIGPTPINEQSTDQLLVKTKHSRVHERLGEKDPFASYRVVTLFTIATDNASLIVRLKLFVGRKKQMIRRKISQDARIWFYIATSRVYAESDVPTTTNNAAPLAREPMRRDRSTEQRNSTFAVDFLVCLPMYYTVLCSPNVHDTPLFLPIALAAEFYTRECAERLPVNVHFYRSSCTVPQREKVEGQLAWRSPVRHLALTHRVASCLLPSTDPVEHGGQNVSLCASHAQTFHSPLSCYPRHRRAILPVRRWRGWRVRQFERSGVSFRIILCNTLVFNLPMYT